MRRFFDVKYFYVTSFLIDGGLFKLSLSVQSPPSPRVGGFDLNLPAPGEESPMPPCFQTSPARSVSKGNHNLFGDEVESIVRSSTGVTVPISSCSTSSTKRQSWDNNIFLREGERDSNPSSKQIYVTSRGGESIPNIFGLNGFRLEEVKKARNDQKGKDILDFQIKNTQKGNGIEYFSVLDWDYVNLGQPPQIFNQNNIASGELRDVKELFEHLNKIQKTENSRGAFWVRRSCESSFFKDYVNQARFFKYPETMTQNQRMVIIHELTLEIYNRRLLSPQRNYLEFLEKIPNIQSHRIDRMRKIMKNSIVLSITYLSLFKEHKGDTLNEEHILEFADFMKKLLNGLAEVERLEPNSDSFLQTWHSLLLSQSSVQSSAKEDMTICWNTVHHWIVHKYDPLRLNISPKEKPIHKHLIEVIQKIILFSNSKTINQRFERYKENSRWHKRFLK
jgi:hypothetical protein